MAGTNYLLTYGPGARTGHLHTKRQINVFIYVYTDGQENNHKYIPLLLPAVVDISVADESRSAFVEENTTSTDGRRSKHSTRDTGRHVNRMNDGWIRM